MPIDILAESDYTSVRDALEHAKELGILIYQEQGTSAPTYIAVGPELREDTARIVYLLHLEPWEEGTMWRWQPMKQFSS